MALRSLLCAVLAAFVSALVAVPASAQSLRAAQVREVAPESVSANIAPAAASMGDGYLVAWRSNKYELAARRVDASGAPAGPLRTIPKGPGIWDPAIVRLLPEPSGAVLVTREVEDGGGYGRVMLRRLAADGALISVTGR
jgi:hypothetical protein